MTYTATVSPKYRALWVDQSRTGLGVRIRTRKNITVTKLHGLFCEYTIRTEYHAHS